MGKPAWRVLQAGTLAALRDFVRRRAATAGFSAEIVGAGDERDVHDETEGQ